MKVDVIVVGQGLAGSIISYKLIKQGKSVLVFSDSDKYKSSTVAAGMFNPLVLKRFTLCWKATEFMPVMYDFYADMEAELGERLIHHFPIFRLFHDEKEAESWLVKTDHPVLSHFMEEKIRDVNNKRLSKQIGLGEVKQTGRVDLNGIIGAMSDYIERKATRIDQAFDYSLLTAENGSVEYKEFQAEKIVFSEGFGMNENPFFSYLPLDGTKGELITIKAPELKLDKALKAGIFIMPLGNDHYRIGATFNWKQKDCIPTEEGLKWLLKRLDSIMDSPYEIVAHEAGIRPTVNDRRPLIGRHPNYPEMYVLNGFGTRGILMGPSLADSLLDLMYSGKEPDIEFNIKRYEKYLA